MRKICVVFRDGCSGEYTMAIWKMAVTDPDVRWITDAETGEIMFDGNGKVNCE